MTLPSTEFDAAGWLARWERQQAGHVAGREQTFALMLDVVARLAATTSPRLLDLACGPGSLAARALDRFPEAEVVALDVDPVMIELGRRTLGDRVHWVEADLRDPNWPVALPGGEACEPFDAVVSATGLHWLAADQLPALAAGLAPVLRFGGVFLDFDTLRTDPATPRLAALNKELRDADTACHTGTEGFEDFFAWWDALSAEGSLAELLTEREHRLGDRSHSAGATVTQWESALHAAGFAEVAPLTQHADRRLLAAIR